jgi:hypothetical protein
MTKLWVVCPRFASKQGQGPLPSPSYSDRLWDSAHPLCTVAGSLFNNTFSVTRLYSLNDRMVCEWRGTGRDLVGSGCGLTLRYYPGIRLEGLRKTTKTSTRIAGRQTQESNHSTTMFSVHCIQGGSFPGIKCLRHEAVHSSPYSAASAEVKDMQSYTFTLPHLAI